MKQNLITPKYGYYSQCISCGLCCRAKYKITLSEEEKQRLETLYPDQKFGEYIHKSYSIKPASEPCVFLNEENKCKVHVEHGEAKKPLRCRTFPWLFTSTPDGIVCGLSWMCPAVKPFPKEAVTAPSQEIACASGQKMKTVSQKVSIFPSFEIEWELYKQLENYIQIFLTNDALNLPFSVRLMGLNVFFHMLQMFAYMPENRKKDPNILVALFLESLRKSNFSPVIQAAEKMMEQEKGLNRKLWWFISDHFRALVMYPRKGRFSFMFQYYKHLAQSASKFAHFQQYPLPFPWEHPLVRGFISHLWERKFFLHPALDVYSMQRFLTLILSILPNHYKHLIQEQEDIDPDQALQQAIAFIELNFTAHFDYNELERFTQTYRTAKYINLLRKKTGFISSLFYL